MAKTSLGVRQTAVRLGVTLQHTYALLWEGKLPGAVKVGKRWVIPIQAVTARLEARNDATDK